MIVSLACPQRRPQPGSWPQPGRLPRAPCPSPDTRSWPSVSARALLLGRGVRPAEPVPGRPQPPPIPLPHPASTRGRSRLPLPARTPLYPPCAKPQRAPQLGMVPLQRCQGPGGALGRCAGCRGCGPRGSSPGTHRGYLLPSPPPAPRHKLSQACFGGKRGRGHLQVSFTDFGTVTVSAPRVSPPWALGRAPHPRRRRLPRRERGRDKKLGLPCPSPARVLPGPGAAPVATGLGAVLDEGD